MANIDRVGLVDAAESNNISKVTKILNKHPNMINVTNEDGDTALMVASSGGHIDIVKLLLEKGADVNAKNEYGKPVLMLVDDDSIEIMKLILEKGADINAKNEDGETTLMNAATEEYVEIVKLLLEKGADVNATDNYGNTALMSATNYGNIEIMKLLLEKGADVNAKDMEGDTALMRAASGDDVETVKFLLEKGADVNAENVNGNTPLMNAASEGQVEIVKFLLEKGADVNHVNKKGMSVATVATAAVKTILLPKWKGYSASDVEIFSRLFKDPTVYAAEVAATPAGTPIPVSIDANISLCPICLSFSERLDGCMYMSHKCPVPRHEALYNTFKDSNGMIEWCTSCGRVTSNHRHYKLSDPTDPRPGFAAKTPDATWQFSDKYCIDAGGGGYKEKVKRFNRLLDHAGKLQSEVDKISDTDARNELVEEMWRAARGRNLTDKEIQTIVETRKFNVPEGVFPAATASTATPAETVYPDILRPVDEKDLTPIEHKQPDNACVIELNSPHDDNRPVWQFRHKQPDGSVYAHTYTEGGQQVTDFICADDLETAMRANTIDGKCPLRERCKGLMYPEEIKGIVTPEWYEVYRKKFNEIMRPQRGGNLSSVPILRKIDDDPSAVCSVPRRGARRTYRKKQRKTRKRQTRARK